MPHRNQIDPSPRSCMGVDSHPTPPVRSKSGPRMEAGLRKEDARQLSSQTGSGRRGIAALLLTHPLLSLGEPVGCCLGAQHGQGPSGCTATLGGALSSLPDLSSLVRDIAPHCSALRCREHRPAGVGNASFRNIYC